MARKKSATPPRRKPVVRQPVVKNEPPYAAEAEPPTNPFPVVGLGASAGGLEAFSELLRALPPDTGMAFVLIQHMDPTHQSMLSEILARSSKMPVGQVKNGVPVAPNNVYVIPPGTNMVLSDGVLRLSPRTEE